MLVNAALAQPNVMEFDICLVLSSMRFKQVAVEVPASGCVEAFSTSGKTTVHFAEICYVARRDPLRLTQAMNGLQLAVYPRSQNGFLVLKGAG